MSEQGSVPAPAGAGDESAQTPAGAAPDTARARPGRWGVRIALLALLVALAALGGAGWLGWHQYREARVRASLESRVAALRVRLEATAARLDRAEAAHEARDRDLERAFSSLRTRLGRDRGGWIVAEAGYLLSIANQRAQLSGDAATALAALEEADRRLAALADPAFRPVRERIAQEIAALKAAPRVDLTGIEARIAALIAQVDTLPVAGARVRPIGGAGGPARGAATHGWRSALREVGDSLRSLVVVRRVEHPARPLLAPEQRYFLYQNLILQLETARLALLGSEPGVYRSSLETAGRWDAEYFDPQAPATRAAETEIRRLAGARVATRLPDLSGSLRLLRRIAGGTYGPAPAGAGAGR
jgi:uroporphyrin-3 C-methyltransferase